MLHYLQNGKKQKEFYLFSDQFFEYAVFSNNKLTVVERGNLSEWEYPNSFEKKLMQHAI